VERDPAGGAEPEFDHDLNQSLDREDLRLDRAWARQAPVHELSAHGRRVAARLDAPPPRVPRPSWWKRLRFVAYRVTHR